MKISQKATFGVLILFILFFMSSVIVNADVIWTPDDNFYQKNSSECTILNRYFTADGSDGKVTLWESPDSHNKTAEYENGISFMIWYTYTDKKSVVWGLYDSTLSGLRDGSKITGWLRMEDLNLVYDNISFWEEHVNEFRRYSGELDDYTTDLPIIIWDYPGSGHANESLNSIDTFGDLQYIYTDTDGKEWAFLQYTKGHLEGEWDGVWIYISDPTNKDLPAAGKDQPDITIASDVQPLVVTENGRQVFLILGIAVVVLVAATAVLIRLFWKKDKKGSKS